MSDVQELVRSLAEPVLARHGCDLVEVQVKRGRTQLVRVIADRTDGIDLETCAAVNAELSRMLDVEDPIDGSYTLEVTSPGLDRPLRTSSDFGRVLGKRVRVVLEDGGQAEGTVEAVGEDAVHLDGARSVRLTEVKKAKLLLPW